MSTFKKVSLLIGLGVVLTSSAFANPCPDPNTYWDARLRRCVARTTPPRGPVVAPHHQGAPRPIVRPAPHRPRPIVRPAPHRPRPIVRPAPVYPTPVYPAPIYGDRNYYLSLDYNTLYAYAVQGIGRCILSHGSYSTACNFYIKDATYRGYGEPGILGGTGCVAIGSVSEYVALDQLRTYIAQGVCGI